MGNFEQGQKAPEKEHSLPQTFIDKREEFYASKSNITQAIMLRDEPMLTRAVLDYMVLLDYMCNRIKPKLRGRYHERVSGIQTYLRNALRTTRAGEGIPDQVIQQLDEYHDTICEAMVSYGFDQITPTVLNI